MDSLKSTSTSTSLSASQLFFKVFGNFGLSPTITAINYSTFHNLIQTTQFKPKPCVVCFRLVKCGVSVVKCTDCGVRSHPRCEKFMNIMCAGPRQSGILTLESRIKAKFRYPSKPPYVPFPILSLINEVELKLEAGVYCLPINSAEGICRIREILRKFQMKKPQNLRQVDVHILTNCLLEVLKGLGSACIVRHWHILKNENDCFELDIEALPKPNRNVLIILLLHFQYISQQETSRMSLKALAQIFSTILFENASRYQLEEGAKAKDRIFEIKARNLLHQLLQLDSTHLLKMFALN